MRKNKRLRETLAIICSVLSETFSALLPQFAAIGALPNCVHWVLDMAFREDDSPVRVGYAAHNLGMLRHLALNLLRLEKTAKIGIKAKRRTGWVE
jgi:predicted transposase YbfD/YdcC